MSEIRPGRRETAPSATFHLLGVTPLDDVLAVQQRLVYEISGERAPRAVVLVCEHPPIITIGREGSRLSLRNDDAWRRRGYDVRWLNRGGGALVHAPGQLAVYPIVPLERFGLSVGVYLERLQQTLDGLCDDLRVSRVAVGGRRGIWCRGGQAAFVGVAVKSWVAYHGLFLNVDPPAELIHFAASDPDGMTEATTFSAELRRPVRMPAVRQAVIERLSTALGCERYHVLTGHPQLARTIVSPEGAARAR